PIPAGATPQERAALRRDRVWRYLEFRGLTVPKLREVLTDPAALAAYKTDPFNPFAIARLRLTAFQKWVVTKYVDNLLDWGDSLFTEFTTESIDEATMLYALAEAILGDRPADLGECGEDPSILTYQTIAPALGSATDFLIELETLSIGQRMGGGGARGLPRVRPGRSTGHGRAPPRGRTRPAGSRRTRDRTAAGPAQRRLLSPRTPACRARPRSSRAGTMASRKGAGCPWQSGRGGTSGSRSCRPSASRGTRTCLLTGIAWRTASTRSATAWTSPVRCVGPRCSPPKSIRACSCGRARRGSRSKTCSGPPRGTCLPTASPT